MWTMRFQCVAFQLTSFSGKLIFWHVWAQFHVLFLTFKILQMSSARAAFWWSEKSLGVDHGKETIQSSSGWWWFPFSWEWNVIIPTDFKSIIFQRGRSTQPSSSPEGFLYSSPGFCRNIQRESPLHCTKVPDLERLPLGDDFEAIVDWNHQPEQFNPVEFNLGLVFCVFTWYTFEKWQVFVEASAPYY